MVCGLGCGLRADGGKTDGEVAFVVFGVFVGVGCDLIYGDSLHVWCDMMHGYMII